MPGQTENYGIRYPCPGDPINPADFGNWAADIESAIEEVDAAAAAATLRPRIQLRTSTAGVAIPVGVGTTITYSDIIFNEGMFPGLVGPYSSIFPLENPANYIMVATLNVIPLNTATTVTSFQATMTLSNDTVGRTLAATPVPTIAKPITLIATGFIDSVFGASSSFLWTGTGGPLNIYAQFSASFVARL